MSSFEGIIGEGVLAAMNGDSEAVQRAEDKSTLMMLVQRRMFCQQSGKVLDVSSAVAFEFNGGEDGFFGPVHPSVLEENGHTPAEFGELTVQLFNAAWPGKSVTVNVLDGSKLFGKGE